MNAKKAFKIVCKLAKEAGQSIEAYCATRDVSTSAVMKWNSAGENNTKDASQKLLRKLGVVK